MAKFDVCHARFANWLRIWNVRALRGFRAEKDRIASFGIQSFRAQSFSAAMTATTHTTIKSDKFATQFET